MSLVALFIHLLTARKVIPAQVLAYIISFQSQQPFRVDTHFTDAETDSMPAQRPLLSIQVPPPATPREHSPRQSSGIGWESRGLGETLGENCPITEPLTLLVKQTLSCYLLTANCRGLLESYGNEALQGLWQVGASSHHSAFPGKLPHPGYR